MRLHKRAGLALLAMTLMYSSPALAQLCYQDSDENNPGNGVPVAWENTATTEIGYKVYVPTSPNLPAKAMVIAAIDAAFKAYTDIPCSTIKFKNAGELTTLVTENSGFITVYFGKDSSEWIYGNSAYNYQLRFKSLAKGDIDWGTIGMNAATQQWAIGAEANKIDVQTAVMQMIPGVIGYYVGTDPVGGSVDIKYNTVNHTVSADQTTGAQYTYHDSANSSCTQPAKPNHCPTAANPGDAGPGSDADGTVNPGTDGTVNPGTDGTVNPGTDGTVNPGTDGTVNPGTDGGTSGGDGGGGSGDDDGCCRVSHARSANIPFFTLLGLALFIGLTRRRWRKRK
ncbi:MAG: hypothetical protein KC503_07505 [Myxococcales bacterium]|nr:hypothetical protein [Myxococcales bacterium]